MRTILALTGLALGGAVLACTPTMVDDMSADKSADMGAAHTHIGHVLSGWKDTPENKGFLPTAIAEAMVADKHAGLAVEKLYDLKYMQTHALHVLHAIDPTAIAKGPGLGYGVIRAAAGAIKHIEFAAGSDGASDNVKLHATHVAASANNAVERAQLILIEIEHVRLARTARQANHHVVKIRELAAQLLDGYDADGDGKISWKPGEPLSVFRNRFQSS